MEYTTGWIDFVPDGWNIMNFGQVIERISTGLNPRDNFKLTKTDKRYYVTIKNFKDGKLYLDDKCDRISENAWEVIQERSDLHKGDILLASISKEGQVYLLKEEPNNWNVNESVFCIRVNKRCMNNRYFCYEITNVRYYDDLLMDATGTTFKSIKQNNLKQSRLLVPPLSEQQAIADYLDETCSQIDVIIAEAKASIDEYENLRQSIIYEILTKGPDDNVEMKDSGVEWIGKVPSHWMIGKVKYGTTKVGSGKTPKGGAEVYMTSGVMFLRSQNIYNDGLKLDNPYYISEEMDEEMKNTRVQKNDVLLNITGGSIGRCCIFDGSIPNANVNQHVCIIRVNSSVFLPEYMHLFWISPIGQISIKSYQTGGNREGMSAEAIKNTPIPIIPIGEQRRIVDLINPEIDDFNSLISEKESLINDLEAYKKSLIYEVVTGKRRVV